MSLVRAAALCVVLGVALLAPDASPSNDGFKSKFNPDLVWHWDIPQPGKPPLDTKDENAFFFALGEPGLDIVASEGTLYGPYEEGLKNTPNLIVKRVPDNWYIETAIKVDWKPLKEKEWEFYEQASVFIARDCDHFMNLLYGNSGGTKDGKVMVGLNMQTTTTPDDSQGGFDAPPWKPTDKFVKLRIEKAATGTPPKGYNSKKAGFSFWYDSNDGKGWQQIQFTLDKESIAPSEPLKTLYKLLMEVGPGWRIGLMANAGGADTKLTARFQYFKTDIEVRGKDDK